MDGQSEYSDFSEKLLLSKRRHRRLFGSEGSWRWTALIIVVPIIALTAVSVTVLLLTVDLTNEATARIELVKTGLAVGAGTGGIVALVLAGRRQWSNEQTARSAEYDATERRITELYTKAIEQLGHAGAAVRLGGLYALERLGQNNKSQRETILNVICAYLRMPYVRPGDRPNLTASIEERALYEERLQQHQVRQAAQRIIHRHCLASQAPKAFWTNWWNVETLDLTGADLAGADLRNADLKRAEFTHADLTGANLAESDLTTVDLREANLTNACLFGAVLVAADLTGADLTKADLSSAQLKNAIFTNANLTEADLSDADLSGVNLTEARLNNIKCHPPLVNDKEASSDQ